MRIKGRLIYIVDKNRGLLFLNGGFYILNLGSGSKEKIAQLPIAGIKRVCVCLRPITRLLRMEPRCAGRLDENRYVVSMQGKLWLLNILNRELTELCAMRQGFSLLNFCECNGCVYWGDYGSNGNYEEVNIYKLDGNLNCTVAYTFPKGSVRHIHNIVKDGSGFIVMCGDNEPHAGIYRTNADWSEVKPWKNGEQKYRAVVGFPYNGGLLYATDSVETENHLRIIKADGTERILTAINGSCIYGGETRDYYFFSTTVEPHEGGGLRKMMSYELGGGVKSRDVHLLAVRKSDLEVRLLMKLRKDLWPMKLFQYGTMIFPKGQENIEKVVWSYNMACKKNDGKTLLFKCDE